MLRTVPVGICWKVVSGFINNVSMKRPFYSDLSKILFTASDKNLPIPTQLTPLEKLYSHNTDLLMEQLRKSKTIERVLELITLHIDVMNDNHITTCFSVIGERMRGVPFSHQSVDLKSKEAFQALCNRAMNRARFLQPSEIIKIFKTLSSLDVRSNTYVVQAMLKMLCSHVNDLNLNELIFLNFLLARQRPNPVVSSLQLAVPLVIQVQLTQQLDSENVNEVANSLKIAGKAKLKREIIQKVINFLQSKVSSFSPENAVDVIFALFSMEAPTKGYFNLLQASFDIVNNGMDEIEKRSLLIMSRHCRKHGFYYRSFFYNLAKRVALERWELFECYELLSYLNGLGYFSSEILDLVSQRIIENPEAVIEDPKYSILTLTELYTFADYQACNIHNIVDALSAAEKKISSLEKFNPHLYFKLITSWAILGCIQKKHLLKILDENFLFSALSSCKKQGRTFEFEQYVHALQWSLENADEHKYQIPSNFMKIIVHSHQQRKSKSLEYPLSKFLENGLGGSQFFYSGAFTRNNNFVDHVLVMRTGSYAISLTNLQENFRKNQVWYIDDLQLPDDAKILTIIVATEEDYCNDPYLLRGLPALRIRNLRKMLYSPIVINYKNWAELADREKIPYLMKEIRAGMQTELDITL